MSNYYNEKGYQYILQDVLNNGSRKSIFGHDDKYILSNLCTSIKYDCSNGTFPLMTARRINWKLGVKEMLWFIEGSRDVAKLHRSGCLFWDDWAVKYYNKINNTAYSLNEWQELVDDNIIESTVVPLHYSNATHWPYVDYASTQLDSQYKISYLDQTKWVIDNIKRTPDRKSFVVSYWDPTQVYQMADECGNESVSLPACHYSYTLNVTNNKLNLTVVIRSQDLILGHPTNVAQYAALLNMYSICTGFEVGDLGVLLIDYHLYSNHLDIAQEVIKREPRDFPTIEVTNRGQQYLQDFVIEDFNVSNYKPLPYIKGDITVVGGY